MDDIPQRFRITTNGQHFRVERLHKPWFCRVAIWQPDYQANGKYGCFPDVESAKQAKAAAIARERARLRGWQPIEEDTP